MRRAAQTRAVTSEALRERGIDISARRIRKAAEVAEVGRCNRRIFIFDIANAETE